MEQARLAIETHPEPRDVDLLGDHLDAFNLNATRVHDFKKLAVFLRDASAQIIAGLYGYTWGGCFDIKMLWVHQDVRGRGLGSALLRAAEQEAVVRGCHVAMLDTHSFQAPEFYRERGYEEFGVLDGYPLGHKKHFFKKGLKHAR